MSAFLDIMIEQAAREPKRIVLPEGNDRRTLEAAEEVLKRGFAEPIILGDPDRIAAEGFALEGARIIDPSKADVRDDMANMLYELRKAKGVTLEGAYRLLDDDLYFGVMLVKMGMADGMVAGACHATGDVLRPSLQILRTAPGIALVSSFFIMIVPDCPYGENGVFLFADCALEVQPSAEKLAHIAVNSANSFRKLIGAEPRVALLSHSTAGSASNSDQEKVIRATEIAHELDHELLLDGEMQLDAAIVAEIGERKAPNSPVAGKANVLIFPDLDSGNIGYKLVERLAKAEAFGPITQGIAAPVNDLSRGCTAEDIVGVIAITCVQAQSK